MLGGAEQGFAKYLLAPLIAWLLAQSIKYLLNRRAQRGQAWRLLYQSGNMPSAHTATLVSLTTMIGIHDGLDSGLFALAVIVTAMAAYDALMVRRSGGEQGIALRKLLEISPFKKDPFPYQALGHRPLEVAVGALLGVVVAVCVGMFTTI